MTRKGRWVRCIGHWKLPAKAGVYVVYHRASVVYVGSAMNMARRFSLHFGAKTAVGSLLRSVTDDNCEDLWIKFRCSKKYGEWAMAEIRLIRKLRPSLNIVGKSAETNHKPRPLMGCL